jgi:hypothetical protein
MPYLQPADYEAYGLAPETADELVTMASALIEGHCRRPSLFSTQYVERVRLAESNQTARLSYGPLGTITAVRVRYGRSSREGFGSEVAQAFGLPGTWSSLDPATLDVYLAGREISFAYNVLGLAYNEAEITYTAGFTAVPDHVKAACAQIVKNAQTTPGLNVKTSRLDTMQMEYFGPTLIDDGVRALLKPFVAEKQ